MLNLIKAFVADRSGATAIEYGLIASLLALGIIGGVGSLSNKLGFMWGDNASRLNQAMSAH